MCSIRSIVPAGFGAAKAPAATAMNSRLVTGWVDRKDATSITPAYTFCARVHGVFLRSGTSRNDL